MTGRSGYVSNDGPLRRDRPSRIGSAEGDDAVVRRQCEEGRGAMRMLWAALATNSKRPRLAMPEPLL